MKYVCYKDFPIVNSEGFGSVILKDSVWVLENCIDNILILFRDVSIRNCILKETIRVDMGIAKEHFYILEENTWYSRSEDGSWLYLPKPNTLV